MSFFDQSRINKVLKQAGKVKAKAEMAIIGGGERLSVGKVKAIAAKAAGDPSIAARTHVTYTGTPHGQIGTLQSPGSHYNVLNDSIQTAPSAAVAAHEGTHAAQARWISKTAERLGLPQDVVKDAPAAVFGAANMSAKGASLAAGTNQLGTGARTTGAVLGNLPRLALEGHATVKGTLSQPGGVRAALGSFGSYATAAGSDIRKAMKTRELSAREQLNLICFTDPRPRNDLGMFTDSEGGPNPEAIGMVYKQPQQPGFGQQAAASAVGGVGAIGAASGLKALAEKLKKAKGMKLSAREQLDEIKFGLIPDVLSRGYKKAIAGGPRFRSSVSMPTVTRPMSPAMSSVPAREYSGVASRPSVGTPVAPPAAPSTPSVTPPQGGVKTPTASLYDHARYRLRGWRGAAAAGVVGVGAGYAMSGQQHAYSARDQLNEIRFGIKGRLGKIPKWAIGAGGLGAGVITGQLMSDRNHSKSPVFGRVISRPDDLPDGVVEVKPMSRKHVCRL